jgi:hypothetical protein
MDARMNTTKQTLFPNILSLCLLILLMVACTPNETLVTPAATAEVTDLPQDNAIADRDEGAVEDNTLGVSASEMPLGSEYIDEAMGLSLNYPNNWYAQGDEGFTVILTSYSLADDATAEPAEGETKIDIQLIQSEEQLQSLLAEQGDLATAEATADATAEVDSAGPVRILAQTFHEDKQSQVTIVQVGERYFLITGYGDLTDYDSVLESLSPVAAGE